MVAKHLSREDETNIQQHRLQSIRQKIKATSATKHPQMEGPTHPW
jgi:hypothetical protein